MRNPTPSVGIPSAEMPSTCLAAYGASKAFLKHLAPTLNVDEHNWQPNSVRDNVSVLYIVAASICTAARPLKPTLFGPSAESEGKVREMEIRKSAYRAVVRELFETRRTKTQKNVAKNVRRALRYIKAGRLVERSAGG